MNKALLLIEDIKKWNWSSDLFRNGTTIAAAGGMISLIGVAIMWFADEKRSSAWDVGMYLSDEKADEFRKALDEASGE